MYGPHVLSTIVIDDDNGEVPSVECYPVAKHGGELFTHLSEQELIVNLADIMGGPGENRTLSG